MRGFLFRDWLATGLLATGIVVGAMALSEPVHSQSSEHAKAEPNLTPTPKARPICGMDFSLLVGLPGWRILEGAKLQAYLSTLFTNVPNGDAMAYMVRGDKVALVLGRGGCVVARQVIPLKVHDAVVLKALGMVV